MNTLVDNECLYVNSTAFELIVMWFRVTIFIGTNLDNINNMYVVHNLPKRNNNTTVGNSGKFLLLLTYPMVNYSNRKK